jgi:hypothetical protein
LSLEELVGIKTKDVKEHLVSKEILIIVSIRIHRR